MLCFVFVLLGISANLNAETLVPIGAGSTYKTIQTAYDAIKTAAVTTAITDAYVLELQGDYVPTSGTTLETFPITLNAINGASLYNTITIRPKVGVNVTLSYPNQTVVATNVSCAKNATSITLTTVSNNVSVLSTSSYVAGQGVPNNPFQQLAGVDATNKTLTLLSTTIGSIRTNATLFFGPQQTKTINFDGAKYVIIDGVSRTDASTGLTISNPNCIYSQTIYFQNSASYNTIKNCIIRGANTTCTNSAGGVGATIFFNTADHNAITQNDVCDMNDGITPMPIAAFQLTGVGNNTYNTIYENNIYNIENLWASASANCGFIQCGSGGTSGYNDILNNKLYWTRTANFGTTVVVIGTGGGMSAPGNRFEGNTIGYENANGTGTATLNGPGATFKGVSAFRNFTCKNNIISNIDFTGASFSGIEFGTSGASTASDDACNGNTVQNIKLTLSAPGTLSGITVNAANNYDSNIKTNIVRNLTAESATPTFACTVVGINVTGAASAKIYNYSGNQIYNLTAGKSTSTAANVATGLTIGGNAITVEKNIIYNIATLNSTALAPSIVTGIQTTGGNTTGTVVKNNIVRLGTDFSNDATICGINQATVSATTNKAYFYNNSIYIGGTSPATSSQNSFAFYTATTTIPTNNDIENNIFVNQRVSQSGIAKHYALGYGTAGAINLSDYNLYFATPLGLGVGVEKTTLTDFTKAASDAHSLTGTPGFNDPTATSPDLTYNTTINTVDGKGVTTTPAVADDYAGITRTGTMDIGAYNYTSSGTPISSSIAYSGSGSAVTDNPIPLTITFGAAVTGFDINDLVVRNGVAANFSGSGTTYTVNIIPTGAAISVDVSAGAAVDGSGNATSQATQWSVAYNSVTVTATLGTTSANYPTVKTAFDAINAGTHKGVINIALYTSTTESASAVLNASGSGSASYTSVNIYPMASNLVIAGNLTTPLIDLNGADNVTINGSVNQANDAKSLNIINYSNSATAGNSTIRLYNDAKTNTIKYCTIKGSTMDATGGVVFVSTGPTDGNDDNIITYNDITNAFDANRPLVAINSIGATTINDNLEISNNNIFDFFNRGTASYGVYLGANTSAAKIKDNSFYETTTFIPTAAVALNVIYITNTSGINFDVSNNNIGGQAATCGGNAWTKTNANNNLFSGIYLNVGTSTASSIQNNTIKKFDYSNNGTQTWSGITVVAGNVNIGTVTLNTIGASTGNTSILYTSSGTGVFYGINSTSAGTVTCKNNLIGGITSTTSAGTTYGIYHNVAASTLDCQFNTITSILTVGNTAATSSQFKGVYVGASTTTTISTNTVNNINASSASTSASQSVIGIQIQGATTLTVSGNTVYTITNSVNNSTTAGSNLYGIYSGAAATQSITGNTIYDLTVGLTKSTDNSIYGIGVNSTSATGSTVTGNTIYGISSNNSSFAGPVTGIYYNGKSSGTNSVARNFIYGLSVDAATTAASIYGIRIVAGATTYANNMINLGGNTQSTLYGIYETGAANNNNTLYHNSVYIGGAPTAGSLLSYALFSNALSNTRIFRNNIFVNARANGSSASGKNYAAYFNYTASTNLTLSNNIYYAPNSGSMLGYYNNADVTNAIGLPLITGLDSGSINADPHFTDATATTPDMTIDAAYAMADVKGVNIAGVTDDKDGKIRADYTPTDLGAYVYTSSAIMPSVTITSLSATVNAAFTAIFTFGSAVTGFTLSDIVVGNGSATVLATTDGGITYTATITPTAVGSVTVNVAAGVAYDATTYANNTAATLLSVTYKLASSITATNSATFTYDGTAQGPSTCDKTGSTGAVTYSYVGVSGTTYGPSATKPTSVGSYTVTATVEADANYEAASSAAYGFTIAKGNQSITFAALPTGKVVGDANFAPGATSATSGTNTITYTSSDEAVATIVSGQIHIVGAGTTTITASQAGNDFYNAATNLNRDLTILLTAPSIQPSSNVTSTGFTAHWTAVAGATNYDVLLYLGASLISTNNVLAPATSYTYTGLTSGASYLVKVIARNANVVCNSIESNSIILIDEDADIATVAGTSTSSSITIKSGVTLSGGGGVSTGNITIEPGGNLNLTSAVTFGDVTFKVDETTAFSAKICSCNSTVNGTVKLLRTIKDTKWYFMSFPCSVKITDITKEDGTSLGILGDTWFIKEYNSQQRADLGSGVSNWKSITNTSLSLEPFKGYIFGIKTGRGTITFSFILDKSIVQNESAQSIPVTYYTGGAGVNDFGWNLMGQPFLSKYASQTGTNMLNLYKYNGTTYEFYARNTNDLPVIDPFTAYFTQVDAGLVDSKLNFELAARQFASSSVAVSQSDLVRLNLTTATGTDKTNLIIDDLQSTSYQIGQDLAKMLTVDTDVPQVYTTIGTVNYANNALPFNSVNNLPLAFYTKTAGTITIHVDASQAKDLSTLMLTDKQTGASIDLLKSDYSFIASAGTTSNRLMLSARKISTTNEQFNQAGGPNVSFINGKLVVSNLKEATAIRVYDMMGRMIQSLQSGSNVMEIKVGVSGMYTVQLESASGQWVKKIVR